ncbi:MAG: M56 family metallopeptidase, partial [Prevotella sp.]|nr:M56 family metallopeptidase [Prevotella sp.]
MGEFVAYSVKVALCLVMFYVFYKLLLSHTTFHAFNRFVILATVVISLLLPFVHITFDEPNTVPANVSVVPLIEMIKGEYEETAFDFSLIHLAVIIYIIGVVVFASRMIVSYACLYRMYGKANKVVTDEDGMRIYLMEGNVSPFSWFGHIVMSMEDYDHPSYKAIMVHEKAHATLRHSADILFCNVLTVVQWFNPVVWLLKSDLQDIHEYEADDHVLKSGIDATGYQLLLVRKAVGGRLFAIANNLNKNSLQKRIKMMKTKRTNRWESMKALVV